MLNYLFVLVRSSFYSFNYFKFFFHETFVVPNVELPPLCSPKFRPGPPSDQSQVLSQFLNDTIKKYVCVSIFD